VDCIEYTIYNKNTIIISSFFHLNQQLTIIPIQNNIGGILL